MNATPREIERIVQEVVRRLRAQPAPERALRFGDGAAPAATRPRSPEIARGCGAEAELHLADRLVTLATIEGRLAGVKTLAVPAGAVVTPAVRDELRRRRVALRCDLPGATAAAAPCSAAAENGGAAVVVAIHTAAPLSAPLVAQLLAAAGGSCLSAVENLAAAVRELARQTGARRGRGVLVTDRPAAALCLANRIHGIRACWGGDRAAVEQAQREIAPNLIVVDPTGSPPRWLAAVRHFAAAPAAACPRELLEQLEQIR